MGGIVNTGISIKCDRCGKEVPVEDKDEEKFYRSWAERSDLDDGMFVMIMNGNKPGETRHKRFEFVCPKCADAVRTLMDKIEMKKSKKTKDKDKDNEPAAPTPVTAQVGDEGGDKDNPEQEPEKTAAEEPETEPEEAEPGETGAEEESEEEPGSDFSDDDLFA